MLDRTPNGKLVGVAQIRAWQDYVTRFVWGIPESTLKSVNASKFMDVPREGWAVAPRRLLRSRRAEFEINSLKPTSNRLRNRSGPVVRDPAPRVQRPEQAASVPSDRAQRDKAWH